MEISNQPTDQPKNSIIARGPAVLYMASVATLKNICPLKVIYIYIYNTKTGSSNQCQLKQGHLKGTE